MRISSCIRPTPSCLSSQHWMFGSIQEYVEENLSWFVKLDES